MNNYKILENDNSLYLAILEDGQCCYLIPDIEQSVDPIEDLIIGLDNGVFNSGDFSEWSPKSTIPRRPGRIYDRLLSDGARVIADNDGVYPDLMGAIGLSVFGLKRAA